MGQKTIWNGDRFLFTLAPRRALRQSRQQISRRERKKLWAKRQSGTETGFYLPWRPVVHFTSIQAADKQERKEKAMGKKTIWKGERFLLKMGSRGKSGTKTVLCLSTPSCIAPEQTADKLERRKSLWAKKQSGTETGYYLPWHPVVHCARADSRRPRGRAGRGRRSTWTRRQSVTETPAPTRTPWLAGRSA
jgi:hypothetical protein